MLPCFMSLAYTDVYADANAMRGMIGLVEGVSRATVARCEAPAAERGRGEARLGRAGERGSGLGPAGADPSGRGEEGGRSCYPVRIASFSQSRTNPPLQFFRLVC